MAKIKIELPSAFAFTTEIIIRITDINYGGHAGNDSILSIIHEARIQFLQKNGLDELGSNGAGMIMRDVGIEFRKEIFYGDRLRISVTATHFETASFDIIYKMERQGATKDEMVVVAKTGMVCYDYARKKIVALPLEMRNRLSASNES